MKTYNGKQIIYDLEGNPVSYGGKTLNWYGKQLKQVTAADGSYTQYDYDANGLRTQKRQYKADGTTDYTVDYVWSDGKIAVQSLTYPLTLTIQGNTVTRDIKIDSKFIYCDDDATPSAIMLENDEYLLVRNLQGDVVAVVNAANGETVVEFSYDPWGNVTRKYSETYTDGATEEELKLLDLVMSALCPVTYRGYNYDFTTGLYYLQSRYYNPEWGRFLNTDDTSIMLTKTDDAFSANMYLYCNNNPVNKVDYSGYYLSEGSIEVTVIKLLEFLFVSTDGSLDLRNTVFKASIPYNIDGVKLGAVHINLNDYPEFVVRLLDCMSYSKQNTYRALAIFSEAIFYNMLKRDILFSQECLANEIEQHILGYLSSINNDSNFTAPWYMYVYGGISSVRDTFAYIPRKIKDIINATDKAKIRKIPEFILSACKTIDISEIDVFEVSQAVFFNYYDGIRSCYKNTMADPYYDGISRPIVYKVSGVPLFKKKWMSYLSKVGD